MNSSECHQRAAACIANADLATDAAVAAEFMVLAAHWRAMAVREIFLGRIADPIGAMGRDAPFPLI